MKYLVGKGLVDKKDNLYGLTQEGRQFVSNLDALGNIRETFKVSVALYVVQKDKILLQKRLRHPFFGDVTSVAGKVLPGERVEEAATRKLLEETGLTAKFELIGINRKIRRNKDGEILEDTFYHICVSNNPTGDLIDKNIFGENFWASFAEAQNYEAKNIDTGAHDLEIIERIKDKKNDWFYFQKETVINDY
jgi:ADP-ribose pyrophosphatase YjhB (NUDIX family)